MLGFLANRRQLRVFACEDEVAKRVGHCVLAAARAAVFGRGAGKLSEVSRIVMCNAYLRSLFHYPIFDILLIFRPHTELFVCA